jgi:hypothetical protein
MPGPTPLGTNGGIDHAWPDTIRHKRRRRTGLDRHQSTQTAPPNTPGPLPFGANSRAESARTDINRFKRWHQIRCSVSNRLKRRRSTARHRGMSVPIQKDKNLAFPAAQPCEGKEGDPFSSKGAAMTSSARSRRRQRLRSARSALDRSQALPEILAWAEQASPPGLPGPHPHCPGRRPPRKRAAHPGFGKHPGPLHRAHSPRAPERCPGSGRPAPQTSAYFPIRFSTARLIVSTPVLIVGAITGWN